MAQACCTRQAGAAAAWAVEPAPTRIKTATACFSIVASYDQKYGAPVAAMAMTATKTARAKVT
ncbi:hypothetical protein [Phenylobacterium sp.]|uniref:hypothetical protein n=1 Tax=Phenylobacterium sp. TaxID=1871053 RepID=UPI00286B038D|nr:hypothetical protein [Phenylobacterium sp.]